MRRWNQNMLKDLTNFQGSECDEMPTVKSMLTQIMRIGAL